MRSVLLFFKFILTMLSILLVTACTGINSSSYYQGYQGYYQSFPIDYADRLPAHLDTNGKKTVLVDPNVHAWGAYASDGHLVRAGIATAGGSVCPPDSDGPDCRTNVGTFQISSLGDEDCYSSIYPRPTGGGLMPYCMHFNDGQALHGSPDPTVVEANVSHGCVRMRIPDAEWMRYNFAQVGTKVVVLPYK